MAKNTASAKKAPATPTAPAVQAKKSHRTVTVGCKVPTGLRLQLCKKTSYFEDTPSGSKERFRYDRVGEMVVVQGPAQAVGTTPRGYKAPLIAPGGYALTQNVDADFFEEWMRQNAQNPIVKNKMIIVHGNARDAAAESRELAGVKSGLEPLNVEGDDPRIPKPISPGVDKIQTADEFAGRAHLAPSAEEISAAEI